MRRAPLALALVLATSLTACGDDSGDDSGDAESTGKGGAAACGATAPDPVKKQSFDGPPPAAEARPYTAVLTTSCGVVTLTLTGDKAPKTVGSFAFLAGKGYFDGTFCHRMTQTGGLTVLQCGDPTGSGGGGPGYRFPDENLTGATYPRGTVAMANAGPGTNGSQFFLVIKDSQLPPAYTPFGSIDDAGLKVLDTILDGGITDGASDGPPSKKVYLEKVTVS